MRSPKKDAKNWPTLYISMAKLKPKTVINNLHTQKRAGTKRKSVGINKQQNQLSFHFPKKHSNNDVLKKLMVICWFKNHCNFLDKEADPRMLIDDHKHFIDKDYYDHFIATNAANYSIRFCVKVGRQRATFGLASEESILSFLKFSEEIIENENQTTVEGIYVTVLMMDTPFLVSIPAVTLVSLFNIIFSRKMCQQRKEKKTKSVSSLCVGVLQTQVSRFDTPRATLSNFFVITRAIVWDQPLSVSICD